MLFGFAEIGPRERYKLLASTVTPRPIAWIVSQDSGGRVNAAPFSFFNAFASDPPVLGSGWAATGRVSRRIPAPISGKRESLWSIWSRKRSLRP